MATSIDGDSSPALIDLPTLPGIEISVLGDAHPLGKWVVFKCCEFATEDDALKAGQRFRDSLLAVGAIQKLGVDVGFDRSTLQFSAQFNDAFEKQHGRHLKPDVHGLMVFEKERAAICRMDARGSVTISALQFRFQILPWISRAVRLTERQSNCAALLNDSFLVTNIEGQFILRVSAIEALCDQREAGAEYQVVIDSLKHFLANLHCPEDSRERAAEMLNNGRRQSVRQACASKIELLLGTEEARTFDKLYRLRSRFLHDGEGRGTLNEASAEALEVGTKLLDAELSYMFSP